MPVSEDGSSELAQRARDTLKRSGNCAQTSFAVLNEEFQLDGAQVLKALTPFPGIALRGETCGAVTGCLMAIGLVYGREDLDDFKAYIGSLPAARRFCRGFEELHGSMACGRILEARLGRKFDLADRGEATEYAAAGGAEACGDVVARSVEMAAEIIRRKG